MKQHTEGKWLELSHPSLLCSSLIFSLEDVLSSQAARCWPVAPISSSTTQKKQKFLGKNTDWPSWGSPDFLKANHWLLGMGGPGSSAYSYVQDICLVGSITPPESLIKLEERSSPKPTYRADCDSLINWKAKNESGKRYV
jgi:hypothetical protein